VYILILITIINSHVSVTTAEFESSAGCLKAISAALELESKKDDIKIKARCVQK
jgi:hypothetical protein